MNPRPGRSRGHVSVRPTERPAGLTTRLAVGLGAALLLAGCTGSAGPGTGTDGTATGSSTETVAAPSAQPSVGPRRVDDLPRWRARAALRTPRDDFASAVVGDEIWAFGGMTGDRGTRLRSSEIYDTGADRWRPGPRLPEGLASFEGVAVGPVIYLFGGLDEQARASDFAAAFDTRTGRWTSLPPLPHPRYAHDVDLLDGRIYVVGGEGADGVEPAVDIFDPRNGTWSRGADLPHPRSSLDLVPVGARIYAIGGWDVNQPTDLVQIYDPATRTWQNGPRLPAPISRGGAESVGDRIFVSWHDDNFVLDTAAGVWATANPMTVPRHGLGYIAVGDRIFGIGGCTEAPLRDVPYVDVLDLGDG